mmetsp:Transcript_30471/g.35500  ORF Transcript_30471/g.35500 Transcript_30471/m.35500 type:complete len:209 (+) Transcript_30471:105-731(+)
MLFITSRVITRNLNETWENAKDKAVDTFEGVQSTLQKNMILSICIGVAVMSLLILCCYLRRKYSRPAQVMTKKEHDKLIEQRVQRKQENERNRGDRNRKEMTPNSKSSRKSRKSSRKSKGIEKQQREMDNYEDDADLANSSFETRATILSDHGGDHRDIENDGIEMKLDPRMRDKSISPVSRETETVAVKEEKEKKKPFGFFKRNQNK